MRFPIRWFLRRWSQSAEKTPPLLQSPWQRSAIDTHALAKDRPIPFAFLCALFVGGLGVIGLWLGTIGAWFLPTDCLYVQVIGGAVGAVGGVGVAVALARVFFWVLAPYKQRDEARTDAIHVIEAATEYQRRLEHHMWATGLQRNWETEIKIAEEGDDAKKEALCLLAVKDLDRYMDSIENLIGSERAAPLRHDLEASRPAPARWRDAAALLRAASYQAVLATEPGAPPTHPLTKAEQ